MISGFEPWVSHPGLVHAPKNVFDSQYFKVEAPGVEDGRARGHEGTFADKGASLGEDGDRKEGQKHPLGDSGCSSVAAALRAASEAWTREADPRRLRLALLAVLRSLDESR